MSQEQDKAESDFSQITGVPEQQARFYLDSAGGNLENAISAYFESGDPSAGSMGDHSTEGDPVADHSSISQSIGSGGGRTLSGAPADTLPAAWGGSSGSRPSSGSSTPNSSRKPATTGPRISGFRDLSGPSRAEGPRGSGPRIGRLQQPDDDDDDDDDDAEEGKDDPATFFAGGEKSGISVENPNKKAKGASDVISGILRKAQEGGSAVANQGESAAGSSRRQMFAGSANTLGSDDTPSTFIPDVSARTTSSTPLLPGGFPGIGGDSEENNEAEETAIRHLTFWSDGFSIEDGDLMSYDDPANADILSAIHSGRAPVSLLKVRHDQPVELRIAKRSNEKWSRQPAVPAGPFAGSGNRLGSPTPGPQQQTVRRSDSSASATFQVDQSSPTTNLQIRLRDGSRMIARFNHAHTIGDIRRYINASRPGGNTQPFALVTAFPPKALEDETQSIEDAGLLGSVIIEKGL